jgi:hypothetical protein
MPCRYLIVASQIYMDVFFCILNCYLKHITNRVGCGDPGENSFATPDWHLLHLKNALGHLASPWEELVNYRGCCGRPPGVMTPTVPVMTSGRL